MFCNKCGKQIPDGTGFCQYCGNRLDPAQAGSGQNPSYPVNQMRQSPNVYRAQTPETGLKGFSIFEILIIVLMGIIAIMWLVQFFANLGYTKDAFDLLGGAAGVFGMILYWVPVLLILGLETLGVIYLLKKQYIISIGALIFLTALIMKIGSWIFNDFELETGSIMAYRIFVPYGSIAGWTVFFSLLITVMLYGKATAQQ